MCMKVCEWGKVRGRGGEEGGKRGGKGDRCVKGYSHTYPSHRSGMGI